jgi:hypothetical protein
MFIVHILGNCLILGQGSLLGFILVNRIFNQIKVRKESFFEGIKVHPTLKCIRLEKEIMEVIFAVTPNQSFANHRT